MWFGAVCRRYNPSKVEAVDGILRKYNEQEAQLVQDLLRVYGASPLAMDNGGGGSGPEGESASSDTLSKLGSRVTSGALFSLWLNSAQ